MNLAQFLFLFNKYLAPCAITLLILAAVVTAVKTRSVHSVLFALACTSMAMGSLMNELSIPRVPFEQLKDGIDLLEPYNSLGRGLIIVGWLIASVGSIALVVAVLGRKPVPELLDSK